MMILQTNFLHKGRIRALWVLELSLQIENQQPKVWFYTQSLVRPLYFFLRMSSCHFTHHGVLSSFILSIHPAPSSSGCCTFPLFHSRILRSSAGSSFGSNYFTRVLPASLHAFIVMFFYLVLALSS